MDKDLKDNLKMVNTMDMELWLGQMEEDFKDNGKMVKTMEKA